MICVLCKKNQADMTYEVDRERPKPLCSACFGRWNPQELDALLGVRPPPQNPPPPVAEGIALSRAGARPPRVAPRIPQPGGPAPFDPAGPPPTKGEEG